MKALYTGIMAVGLVLFLAGCMSPVGPNQTGGTLIGGASGALMGGAIGRGAGNTAAGAAIGGALGALTGALVGKDIDERTRLRVEQGRPLTLEDIKALARANVKDELIISQINATRTVYRLGTAEILDLQSAGVSATVIDYMINTPTAFAPPRPAPVYEYYHTVPAPYPPFFYPPPFPHPFYRRHSHRWR